MFLCCLYAFNLSIPKHYNVILLSFYSKHMCNCTDCILLCLISLDQHSIFKIPHFIFVFYHKVCIVSALDGHTWYFQFRLLKSIAAIHSPEGGSWRTATLIVHTRCGITRWQECKCWNLVDNAKVFSEINVPTVMRASVAPSSHSKLVLLDVLVLVIPEGRDWYLTAFPGLLMVFTTFSIFIGHLDTQVSHFCFLFFVFFYLFLIDG